MFAAAGRIARAVGVPVTADLERGYGLPPAELVERLAEGIRRCRLYLAAGADCVYPFLLADLDALRAFVDRVDGPVNALCTPSGPSPTQLPASGVARVSFGPALEQVGTAGLPAALAAIRAGPNPLPAPRPPASPAGRRPLSGG